MVTDPNSTSRNHFVDTSLRRAAPVADRQHEEDEDKSEEQEKVDEEEEENDEDDNDGEDDALYTMYNTRIVLPRANGIAGPWTLRERSTT